MQDKGSLLTKTASLKAATKKSNHQATKALAHLQLNHHLLLPLCESHFLEVGPQVVHVAQAAALAAPVHQRRLDRNTACICHPGNEVRNTVS